ncbi:MAG TPA: SOS response-associated peptidase [Gammaproteobacteria bacterium]|nr:SOS response-associated peptidase [Gammaproteobacteria bacterium]
MCGRYNLIIDAEALIDFFDIEHAAIEEFSPRYNISPSQDVPIVRNTGSGRVLVLARWGLVPHWSKEEKPTFSTINARADTVADKPTYRDPFKRKRCLVPSTGFYEWKREDDQKIPHHIRLPDGELFAFAGLWDHWDKEGAGFDSYSIIVTGANETMQPIHDRMPVILNPAQYNTWLNNKHFNRAQLESMLVPYARTLKVNPVSRYVNNPKHDDAGCVAL